ncbi:MAG: hypothetical protein RLZZ505_1928 [Verrucomicrobiota bacterium]
MLGIAVWLALRGTPSPDAQQPEEAPRFSRRQDAEAIGSAWVDARLRELRADEAASEKKAATMEEFLDENRKDSEKWWRERNEEIDQIFREARALRSITDPVAALRAAQTGDAGYKKELVIFLHWLETDPDAAMAEMGRNWQLLEREYLPALLERKFGIDWMKAKIADEGAPYRLRTALARELGRQAAHGHGLAGLLGYYNAIPDPRQKIMMVWDFTQEWPLDDPKAVAQFLSGNVPLELRELLLEEWESRPYGKDSWEEAWIRSLHEKLGLDASDYSVPSMGFWGMEASLKLSEARRSMSLDEVVRDCVKEGKNPQEAAGEAIRIKVHDALADGSNLIEMFGEGHMSREELLHEIRREIPGSDAHPDALEREVWSRTAWAAEPEVVARWAAELAQRGDMDELLIQALVSGNIYGDPRIPLRLARYRAVTQGLKDDRPRDRILHQAAYEWIRWQAVSPALAEAWLKKLPGNEPMYAAIRAEMEMERRRKENR